MSSDSTPEANLHQQQVSQREAPNSKYLYLQPDLESWGKLMQFVRIRFGSDVHRNGSIVKQLVKKHGARRVHEMVHGAALLGWHDLRGLNTAEGVGRQWAQAAYWQHQNHGDWHPPEALRAIFAQLADAQHEPI